MKYKNIITPKTGEKISFDKSGKMIVPDHVIVPFIEGDGIGTDITPATIKVVDHAVKTAYGDKKKLNGWKYIVVKSLLKLMGKILGCPMKQSMQSKNILLE